MSGVALKGYHPVLHDTIGELMSHLAHHAKKGSPMDIAGWMSYFGFDFMGKMACVLFLLSPFSSISSSLTLTLTLNTVSSFGHDFGMMRAGADLEGFWGLIESATMYVRSFFAHALPIAH